MKLPELYKHIRNGIFHILCLDREGMRVASGSAFSAMGMLITNYHVTNIPRHVSVVLRRDGDSTASSIKYTSLSFRNAIIDYSDTNSYDYAILDIPEIRELKDIFMFELHSASSLEVGEEVAFAGFPFEHYNLTVHKGIISSKYKSGVSRILQLDASVNPSNSGGPLFDLKSGACRGIITRRATGLSGLFEHLRAAISSNIQTMNNSGARIFLGDFDPTEGIIASHRHMDAAIGEIERQANVGIGYAFEIDHVLENSNLKQYFRM